MIAGPRAGETKIYWDILEVRRVKGEVRKRPEMKADRGIRRPGSGGYLKGGRV